MQRLPMFVETADGTQLYCKDWGEGRPVVFVHSLGMSTELWHGQMAYLAARGCRCVAFDRRGHGRSSQPGAGYELDTLADDLARVVERLGVAGVTLVAHSMGACEVVRYLTRHGAARVARIALLGTTTPVLRQSAANPDGIDGALIDAMLEGWRTDFPGWVVANARPFFLPETSQALVDWGAAMMARTTPRVAIDVNRAASAADLRDELRAIAVPALVLHGTLDASAPIALTGERTAKLLARCDYRVYDGAPHGLMFTHADRVNRDLEGFVAKG